MTVMYLYDHAGVLRKEVLDDVTILQTVEVDVHTSRLVGEGHLQQGRDDTTGRDVMTSHDPSFLDELLQDIEGITEIIRIFHHRHI